MFPSFVQQLSMIHLTIIAKKSEQMFEHLFHPKRQICRTMSLWLSLGTLHSIIVISEFRQETVRKWQESRLFLPQKICCSAAAEHHFVPLLYSLLITPLIAAAWEVRAAAAAATTRLTLPPFAIHHIHSSSRYI